MVAAVKYAVYNTTTGDVSWVGSCPNGEMANQLTAAMVSAGLGITDVDSYAPPGSFTIDPATGDRISGIPGNGSTLTLTPNSGPTAGGTHIIVESSTRGLSNCLEASLNTSTEFLILSDTQIRIITLPGTAGAKSLTLFLSPGGLITKSSAFTFV